MVDTIMEGMVNKITVMAKATRYGQGMGTDENKWSIYHQNKIAHRDSFLTFKILWIIN